MRFMRLELKASSVPTAQTPTSPIAPMWTIFMPATRNSTPAVSAITMVAPKSGSTTASPISTAATPTTGTAPFQNRSTLQPMRSSITDVATTTSILASSLGCILSDPSFNQRCDPLVAGNANTDAMRTTTTT